MVWRFVRYRLSRSFKLDLPKRRLNMSSSLSPELKALCELASREYDPAKLLELTNQISDPLRQLLTEPSEQCSARAACSLGSTKLRGEITGSNGGLFLPLGSLHSTSDCPVQI